MSIYEPALPDDGVKETCPSVPACGKVTLLGSTKRGYGANTSHGRAPDCTVRAGDPAPISLEALGLPPPLFKKRLVQIFDGKPWMASMTLAQVKSFLHGTCGNKFEHLTKRCQTEDESYLAEEAKEKTDDLYTLSKYCISPLTTSHHCSLAQLYNPEGMHVDVFVSHTWAHECQDFLTCLERFAECAVREGVVDKPSADDVSFWIQAFSLNLNREEDATYSAASLLEMPFAKALERARCFLLALDKEATALQRLWVLFELQHADGLDKLIDASVGDVSAASRSLVNISLNSATTSQNQDRCKIMEEMKRFRSPVRGNGVYGVTERLLDILRGALLKCLARGQVCGNLPGVLLRGLGSRQKQLLLSTKATALASIYGNMELLTMCQEYEHVGEHGAPNVETGIGEDLSIQEASPQELSDATHNHASHEREMVGPESAELQPGVLPTPDINVIVDAPDIAVEELPPPIPTEALELFNIGVDFAQRLAILWAADLQWPLVFRNVMRWLVSIFSFDLGILIPSLTPAVRAVAAWILPMAIMLAVRIIDLLHGTSGLTWNMLFSQRWSTTRVCWVVLFSFVVAALSIMILVMSDRQEPLLVALAYWIIVNFVVAFLVTFARSQAQRTHAAAKKHELDDDVMIAGFHKFMHHSLCTGTGLLFVASWLPPVRASLDTVMPSDEIGRQTFAFGIAMMIAASVAFMCLPSLMAAVLYGMNKETKCLGIPIACIWPAPCSLVFFVLVIIVFRMSLIGRSDFMIASGFMLPWNLAMPLATIALSLRMFRSHPFGALIAGDFRFQHHRIIAFILRSSFAIATAFSVMLSSSHSNIDMTDFLPGMGVLVVHLLYIVILRPYMQMVGNALDATGAVVLVLILAVPMLPRSDALDVLLACVPLIFVSIWICCLHPRATLKALWYAPTRMRAKLQATIHSPEWIYARPISEVAQIHPQEVIFWNSRHIDALTYRCCTSQRTCEYLPKLRMLLRLGAVHAQETNARLAAAQSMQDQGFGDAAVYMAALKAQLEHLTKELNSTDAAVRCAAAKSLGKVGEPAVEHAGAIAARCKDWEQIVRVEAARALGQMGPKAAVHTAVLADMLTDKDEETRLAAAQALGQMGAAAFEQSNTLSRKLPRDHPFLGVAASWRIAQKL